MSSHITFDYGSENSFIMQIPIDTSTSVICFLGLVGNGTVIWLLGFRTKRNPFSIYILNLAVADFGLLVSASMIIVTLWFAQHGVFYTTFFTFFFPFLVTHSSAQFLLTAISIDRCVAVFFPLWHRCHQPPHLSTILCALIWFLSFLLTVMTYTLRFFNLNEKVRVGDYQFFVNGLLCLPVMMIATVSLFVKIFFKARQHQRGKLLTIILLTLLFFLLFAFPLNVMFILNIFNYLPLYTLLFGCLNSSVNPAIYFLVEREWKTRCKVSMKMILQKVFKEEEGCVEETLAESQ